MYRRISMFAIFMLLLALVNLTSTPGHAGGLPTIKGASIDVIKEGDMNYHVIEVQGSGLYTVTLLETVKGVVAVDVGPGFVKGFGESLKTYIAAIGKPLSVIITHDHGDHYGAIASLSPVGVYGGTHVSDELNASKNFKAVFKGTVTKVEKNIDLNGITFSFGEVANAEFAKGHNGYVYIAATGDFFAGDLIYDQVHLYIREFSSQTPANELENWIAGLKKLKTDFGDYKRIFVGHGGFVQNVIKTIDDNIDYLTTAHGLISGGTAQTVQAVVDGLKEKYNGYADGGLLFSLPGSFGKDDPGADWFVK